MAENYSDTPPPYNPTAPTDAQPNEAGIQNQTSDTQPLLTSTPYPAPAPIPAAQSSSAYPPHDLQQGAYPPPGANPPHPQQKQPMGASQNVYDQPPPKYQEMPPYNAQQQQQPAQYPGTYGATTVIQQPTLVAGTTTVVHMFSGQPVALQCPNCHQNVTTEICHETGTLAWLICLIMFVLGAWICCWIPFVIDDLKDVIHICPRCRRELGRCRKM